MSWDLILPQAEFAYNNSVNRTTGTTPFELVYGLKPKIPTDVTHLPLPQKVSEAGVDFAAFMSNLHEEVKNKMAEQVVKYAAQANKNRRELHFKEGDLVLIRVQPERFPPGMYHKLHARKIGPFKILKKLGSNAYLIDLPSDFQFSPIFNIEDLTAYQGCMSSQELQDSPSTVPQVQPAPEIIDSILTHQFVSTRRGGYYKFLVKWASKPKSEAVWLQGSEVHRLNPQLYTDYVEHYLPEASYWGREGIDANERDQDSSKEQCVAAATDFTKARGLKYSVLAKIPTMHVNVNVPAK